MQSQTRGKRMYTRGRPCGTAAAVALLCIAVGSSLVGCGEPQATKPTGGGKAAVPPTPYAIDKCSLDVNLQPASHRLEATATLTVSQKELPHSPNGKLQLQLHPDLGIDSIHMAGKQIAFRRVPAPVQSQPTSAPTPTTTSSPASDSEKPPTTYELDWGPTRGQPGTLVIHYGGRLFQDVAAGEKPGKIHNLEMKAHVGEEGIFLSEDGNWYPRLPQPEAKDGYEVELTQFELTATEIP
ncbi:MAG TPA: hypothetical protein VMV94_16740, partial [Phycisphaerae bacterium]|nr:hypothetical protein [Phycisphaerae bacterium]